MLKLYALAALSLIAANNAFAQDNGISLLDDEAPASENKKEDTSVSANTTSATKKEDDSLFNFLGLKIPNFVGSSSNQKPVDENSLVVLTQKADEGDVGAQLKLGYSYLYGTDGLEVDYAQAFHYYNLAAEQNDKTGLNNLGSLYFNGIGVERNELKAAALFAKAAEAGNADAATNLGFMYASGNGIDKNVAIAVGYFEKAAEVGNVISQFMTGCAYYKGVTRKVNYNKAAKYIKAAADAGFDEAQIFIADMYMLGQGYPQNYANAVKYLHAAVNQGNINAMYKLAEIYATGTKYPINIPIAHVLYNLASVRGVANAHEQREKLEARMKIDAILKAQQEAENFVEKPTALTNYIHQTFGSNICSFIK